MKKIVAILALSLSSFAAFGQLPTPMNGLAGPVNQVPKICQNLSGASVYCPSKISDNGTQLLYNGLPIGSGSGTVNSFAISSSNMLNPVFTCSVASPTTNPVLTCSLVSTIAANSVFGNFTSSPAVAGFSASPVFNGSGLTGITPTQVGADASGAAATAQSAAQAYALGLVSPLPVGNGGLGAAQAPSTTGQIAISQSGVYYAPKTVSGDCALAMNGAITCPTSNGNPTVAPSGAPLLGDEAIYNGAAQSWGEGSGYYSAGGVTSFFGDSITFGVGCSVAANCYAALLANYFTTPTDYGVSGSYASDVVNAQIYPNITPGYNTANVSTIMVGTNEANTDGTTGGTTGLLANYYHALMAGVAMAGIPLQYKIQGGNTQTCTRTGTWTTTSYGTVTALQSIVPGSTLSCISLTSGDSVVYANWLAKNGYTSTATFSIDGSVVDTLNSFGYNSTTIPGLAGTPQTAFAQRYAMSGSGTHTYLYTVGTAGAGNPFTVIWTGSPAPTVAPTIFASPTVNAARVYLGGVIYQQTNAVPTTTAAYNSQAQTLANTMAADNIPVRFVNVRNFVNYTTDMASSSGSLANGVAYPASTSPGLHPNDLGHQHLADAFLAAIQPGTPVKTGTLTSNFQITSPTITSASQWNKFNVANTFNAVNPGTLNPGATVYDNGSVSMGFTLLNWLAKASFATYSTANIIMCPGTPYPTSVATWICPYVWAGTYSSATKIALSTGQDTNVSSATTISSTSFVTTGLALPSVPINNLIHGKCSIIWEQSTAVSTVQFGIGTSLAQLTLNVMDSVHYGTQSAVSIADQYTQLGTSTTTTAISASVAPGAIATAYKNDIDITLNTNGTNAPVVTIYALTGNASDAVVIEPGSYCAWLL